MSSDDNKNEPSDSKKSDVSNNDKPKFVKPVIKVTVIEIDEDVYAHDTT